MADIVTSRIFVDGEKGITAAKLNDIVASSAIQPAFYTGKPTAGSADPADIALILKAGAYAQVPIGVLAGSATQAQIWSTRLRSYNAIGNPNFEVDQRRAGGNNIANGAFACDRWQNVKTGTATAQYYAAPAGPSLIAIPGTSFSITGQILNVQLTMQQASLAAGDLIQFNQNIEGPAFRELTGDAHSVSLLVNSSVAGLKFSVAIWDPDPVTKSLVKLCTIPVASTWTLIQLPNLPVFPSGNFLTTPGNPGYQFSITLACGSTYIAPAADTWQTGAFAGAPGMSNFAASPVNSQFLAAMVQHEPGAVCSTLMDKPFAQNYDECLRYYQKSYNYGATHGTVTDRGAIGGVALAGQHPSIYTAFKKPMVQVPTVVPYSNATGVSSNVRDVAAGVDRFANSVLTLGETGFGGFTVTTPNVSQTVYQWQYIADSGW